MSVAETSEKRASASAIPDKVYFKIGEVAEIVGVKPYVLRYWETEFPDIAPAKSKSKQRLYKRKEVEMILRIRDLLYKEKFTIEGARKRLKELNKRGGKGKEVESQAAQITLALPKSPESRDDSLLEIKKCLQELGKILESL
ncbi:MAG TPA: MerR family transcriptional regulator [bacterium]|nr:MerR family transcriptional regulator [bacterium]